MKYNIACLTFSPEGNGNLFLYVQNVIAYASQHLLRCFSPPAVTANRNELMDVLFYNSSHLRRWRSHLSRIFTITSLQCVHFDCDRPWSDFPADSSVSPSVHLTLQMKFSIPLCCLFFCATLLVFLGRVGAVEEGSASLGKCHVSSKKTFRSTGMWGRGASLISNPGNRCVKLRIVCVLGIDLGETQTQDETSKEKRGERR
jgi:hypothetical protein